ncbi:MAG: hypothetical protein ACRDOE_26595, partial [Streptosporangiaceae bacterium]
PRPGRQRHLQHRLHGGPGTRRVDATGVATGVARSSHLVHHDLKHSGLLKEIGPNHLVATVEGTVDALGRET